MGRKSLVPRFWGTKPNCLPFPKLMFWAFLIFQIPLVLRHVADILKAHKMAELMTIIGASVRFGQKHLLLSGSEAELDRIGQKHSEVKIESKSKKIHKLELYLRLISMECILYLRASANLSSARFFSQFKSILWSRKLLNACGREFHWVQT